MFCDELVICVVSLGTGRVPHPWLARKLQPSLLQVLVGTQKLLFDDPAKICLEWIGQCPTSFLANNLLECFPKSKDVQVSHRPRFPCIKHIKRISRRISQRCRTRRCKVLCRRSIDQQKYIPRLPNECSCLSHLFAF